MATRRSSDTRRTGGDNGAGVGTVVKVSLGARSYPIHVGAGLLSDTGRLVGELEPAGRVVVITNALVRSLYGARLERSLRGIPGRAKIEVLEMPDGERFKNLRTVSNLYDAVLDGGGARDTLIVALGGGVVGDVAGFVASTVLRGIRFVQVPTTLLAQVDSSVGGKTGVNTAHGKNLIGAFHQPSLVVADTAVLSTLPDREYRAGLAEVVKKGVIMSKPLFNLLDRNSVAVGARDAGLMTEVVARCCKLKAHVVAKDETDAGLRATLNFGHTFGHAVEKVSKYRRFLHGEAVAMGMVAAARLSLERGLCSEGDVERLISLLKRLGLQTAIPADLDRKALVDAIAFDKKAAGGEVRFILTKGIGSCCEEKLAPRAALRALG